MPLSRQTKSRAALLELGRDILALDPGFYILQCAPWQTPSSVYHRAGSWHIWPSPSKGHAMDVNWRSGSSMNNAEEHKMLMRAALLALQRGFSITFPLTESDNRRGTVANHCGSMLHCHIDCGSYSNIGDRTPAKGGAPTASIVASAIGYLAANGGTVNPGGKVICKGDRGGEVKKLQRYLNGRSGVKPKIDEDGVFGDDTEHALKQWQHNNGLVDDGRYGPKCRAKRRQLHRNVCKRRMLAVTGKIRKGDRGRDVAVLQAYLNSRPHVHPKIKVDKVFGDATERAFKKWQRNNHLTQDAVWGPHCHAKAKHLK